MAWHRLRGVRLNRFDQLVAAGGVAPAQWQFDAREWWLEENGLIMEPPEFPLASGQYLVTGAREVTTVLTVHPKEDDGSLDTRTSSTHEYAVDIGIQKKPPAIENTNLDPLVELTQQIADSFLFGKRPGNSTLVSPRIRILYLQDHLLKLHQFTSVITLTFRGWREPA